MIRMPDDSILLGADGIGECRCEDLEARIGLGAGDLPQIAGSDDVTCWACRPRIVDAHEGKPQNSLGVIARQRIGPVPPPIDYNPLLDYRREDLHPYDPLLDYRRDDGGVPLDEEGNVVAHWLPGGQTVEMRDRCVFGKEVVDWEYRPTFDPDDAVATVEDALLKIRPTLNPTARDLHHIRLEECWDGARDSWWVRSRYSEPSGYNSWLLIKNEDKRRYALRDEEEPQHEWGDKFLRDWWLNWRLNG